MTAVNVPPYVPRVTESATVSTVVTKLTAVSCVRLLGWCYVIYRIITTTHDNDMVISGVNMVHLMNVEQRKAAVDPQTKPSDLGCESAYCYCL